MGHHALFYYTVDLVLTDHVCEKQCVVLASLLKTQAYAQAFSLEFDMLERSP